MIQLVINTNMLREIDERKLINSYAKYSYYTEDDIVDDVKIRNNIEQLLDWDINGDKGLAIYCSKFEDLKRKDWIKLIEFIKDNGSEIKKISYHYSKDKRLQAKKIIYDFFEKKEEKAKKHYIDPNYKVSGRGKKAKPCIYNGKMYQSRQECMYKEGITKHQLYTYLKNNNQM